MANRFVYATAASTTVTANIPNPPGATSTGPSFVVIDSVDWSLQSTSGTTTSGVINFTTDGTTVASLDLTTAAASSCVVGQNNWGAVQGFRVGAPKSTNCTVVLDGGANATRCKLIVIYHYEF